MSDPNPSFSVMASFTAMNAPKPLDNVMYSAGSTGAVGSGLAFQNESGPLISLSRMVIRNSNTLRPHEHYNTTAYTGPF
jgi:hypothetical protein